MQLLSLLESHNHKLSDHETKLIEFFEQIYAPGQDFENWCLKNIDFKDISKLLGNILFFVQRREKLKNLMEKRQSNRLDVVFEVYYHLPKHVKDAFLEHSISPFDLKALAEGVGLEIGDVAQVCSIDGLQMLHMLSNQASIDVMSSYGLDKEMMQAFITSILSKKKEDVAAIQEAINNIALLIFSKEKSQNLGEGWEQAVISAAVAIVFNQLLPQLEIGGKKPNSHQRLKIEMAIKKLALGHQQQRWMQLAYHYVQLSSVNTSLSLLGQGRKVQPF